MLEIGKIYDLEIVRKENAGLYLDGLNFNEIFLHKYEMPKNWQEAEKYEIGKKLKAFIFKDNKDNIVATLKTPFAVLDEIAYLKVVDVSNIGAFMDLGVDKNLFLPFPEQDKKVDLNEYYIVKILLDNKDRLIASTIIDDFISNEEHDLIENQEVDIIVYRITPLGYLSIIDNKYFGILYKNEVFKTLNIGDKLRGFVKKLRKDNKIDLSIINQDIKRFDEFTEQVFTKLKENGELNITDKSSPEVIYSEFNMSKKNFKKAVGALYKKRLIKIEKDKIILIEK